MYVCMIATFELTVDGTRFVQDIICCCFVRLFGLVLHNEHCICLSSGVFLFVNKNIQSSFKLNKNYIKYSQSVIPLYAVYSTICNQFY